MQLTSEQRSAVQALYDQGKHVSAYQLGMTYAPLHAWRGPAARTLAGRLASNLGAPKFGRVAHRLGYREHPSDPDVLYYAARELLDRRGPLTAWQFLTRIGDFPEAPAAIRADWLSLHAAILCSFRDFDAARIWLDRAEAACPNKPWTCCERCGLLEKEDRFPEALEAARYALVLRPWYRPAVQSTAHMLQLLDRDREALDLLTEASTHLQSAPVMWMLAVLQTELGHHADSRRSWDAVVELSPMMEKALGKFLAARRADAAYYVGDFEQAISLGKESENEFHVKMADKLTESLAAPAGNRARVTLPVGFVRQHHMTCAPATLAAISRFWNRPAEQLSVVEAICYDGTPGHSERGWAEAHGFVTREFTVTWESAVALIDRGIPFTLTTVEVTSAHLQAVIGYDAMRGTLLIRDPFERSFGEFIAEPFFERYRWAGPRGLAIVPAERADLLSGLDLPEQSLYDDAYRVQLSLVAHRREAAGEALVAMASRSPGCRLWVQARRAVAAYDGNLVEALAAVDDMLALFPDTPGLLLSRLALLRSLGRREDRLALLEAAVGRKLPHPIFWSEYAAELRQDAREHDRATALLRKAIRWTRFDAGQYSALAGILWDRRQWVEAQELYRFAATLADKDENLCRSYFIACRHFKQNDLALGFLARRRELAGRRSSRPACTLFWAYEELERTTEAFTVLDQALELHPDDGELLLFAANCHARHGAFDKAQALLARAEHRTRRSAWLRGAAEIAGLLGQPAQARHLWEQVLEAEPLSMDAHRNLSRLLSEAEGTAAALNHLSRAAERFPYYYPLQQLNVSWLRDEGPLIAEPAIRTLIDRHPQDPWARRELIWALIETRRIDEALAQAELVVRIDPTGPTSLLFKGLSLQAAGRRPEARDAFRSAIALSVDTDHALRELLNTCDTLPQRREALAFIQSELVRQTIFGDGLLAYRSLAAEMLDPDELLARLHEALDARPDLWHAWSAIIRQLTAMNRLDDALRSAEEALQRFPLLPRLWYDFAQIHRVRGDSDAELAALRQALQINPAWSLVARQTADTHTRRGEVEKAEEIFRQCLARSPLEAATHGGLADLLWKTGKRQEALECISRAVDLDPGYEWAWGMLREWSTELKQPGLALQKARDLTVQRAGEARSWMVLAGTLSGPETLEERLSALARASSFNPRSIDAIDLRCRLLAEAGRFDEAEAACNPDSFGEGLPHELRGRRAWVRAARGEPAAALEMMRPILADHPHYYWGWRQMVLWSQTTGDIDERLRAATAMVAHWPHDAVSLVALADAKLDHKDRPGAKAAYKRALYLSPDYEYAGDLLFDLHFEDAEYEPAEQALQALERHHPNARTSTRRVQISSKTNDPANARRVLADLCQTPWDTTWPIDTSVKAFKDAGWFSELERSLADALCVSGVQPIVAEHYVNLLTKARRWTDAVAFVDSVAHADGVGTSATSAYLHRLAEAQEAGAVRLFIKARADRLRTNARTWGSAGYALHTIRDYRAVVAWMPDWNRKDAEGWMLVNYAEALRAMGKDELAKVVNQKGLSLSRGGVPRGIHSLWVAADTLLAGQLSAVQKFLDEPAVRSLGVSYQFMRELIAATLSVLRAPRPRMAFPQARDGIRKAAAMYPDLMKDREQFLFRRKCLRAMAASKIGLLNRIRCWSNK
jgi:tetratricopeptide (TPR) repeat protein